MMDDLRRLGLTGYEARVYDVLLKLKSATGGEIARKSGVPHGKTYESLHNLAEMGLLTVLPLEPKIFRIIEPKEGLKRLIERRINVLNESRKSIVESISKKGAVAIKTHEKLDIYSGYQKQFEIASYMVESTKEQLLIISKGEKVPNNFMIKVRKMLRKGRDCRFIVHQFNGNRIWVEKFIGIGLNTRFYPTGHFTMVIKDRKECMFVIKNPKNPEDRVVVFFRDAAIALAMAEYFESIWKKAKTIN